MLRGCLLIAVFAMYGLTAEEAEALLGADGGGLPPESPDSFLSAVSDEFCDVFSDAYYDTGTPCMGWFSGEALQRA
jgi:hypothetical protein